MVMVQLEQGYADETAHLNPPHRFVPWVLVNDIPLEEVSYSNLSISLLLLSFKTNNTHLNFSFFLVFVGLPKFCGLHL